MIWLELYVYTFPFFVAFSDTTSIDYTITSDIYDTLNAI